MAVRVEKPLAREAWEDMMRSVFAGCVFLDSATVFAGPEKPNMAPRLQEILAEFSDQGRGGSFARHEDAVVGFWLDPHHNYVAIRFSKASGDEFDGFLVNSIG